MPPLLHPVGKEHHIFSRHKLPFQKELRILGDRLSVMHLTLYSASAMTALFANTEGRVL